MDRTIDLLAELTGQRDREVLDRTLALVLGGLLRARQVTVAYPAGEEGRERWIRRASLALGGTDAVGDEPWTNLNELPAMDERPRWRDCLRSQQPQQTAGPPACSLWPLLTDAGTVGVLELLTDLPLSLDDLHRVGGVLRIYRNMLGMLDYSERDTLTGLLNRKSFDSTFLQATVVEAGRLYADVDNAGRRQGGAMPHWLGVLDIDHFKRVNDEHGHLIGDEVLVLVARIMRGTFRFGDRLYRFGGEEFVVLLSAPDEASAGAAFERLRTNLEVFAFPRVNRVTASIGFSDVRPGDTPQAAFERADRAVYHGKQNGRNQVCSFGALVASGLFSDDKGTGEVELF